MLNKFLNDKGVKFLLKRKKYLFLFKLTFKLFQSKLRKINNPYRYNVDSIDISIEKLKIVTSLKLKVSFIDNYKIYLTGYRLNLNKNIFYLNFKDKESLFSIYRFRWLFLGAEEYQNKGFAYKAIEVLNYYIDNFESIGKKVNETYTICERLLNITYFISILKDNNMIGKLKIDKLETIFLLQLQDILSNIEYRGESTNNHILNNARALYILGIIFNVKKIKDIGYILLSENYDNHIKEGVLEEGSFHYQVLLTRSMLEIYHVAKICNDFKMLDFITDRVQKMIYITNCLHTKYSSKYPLIGDVSPDFPIEFFKGYPYSNSNFNSKWNNIFNVNLKYKKTNGSTCFWEKFEFGKFEVWVIKRNRLMAHSHDDNGSFVVFYNGKEILSDIGRFTYRRNNQFSYMLDQKFHNGVNEEIDIPRESIFYNIFNISSNVKIRKLENSLKVNINDCFKKTHIYKLIFNDDCINIVSDTKISINVYKFNNLFENSIEIENVKIKINKLNINKIIASSNYGELKRCFYIEGSK